MAKDHFVIPVFVPHNGCPFQCIFCNQNEITGQAESPDPSSIDKQISTYLETIGNRGRQVLVGFYGGSFTGVDRTLQREYLSAVQPYLEKGRVHGIRISTRPDFIDDEILSFLRTHGVSQIELGIQSFDDQVLSEARRGYTSKQAQQASVLIRERGFLLGHQFMIGLPQDSWDALKCTVDMSLRLKPDMIRIYPAVIVKNTPMEKMKDYFPLDLDEAIKRTAYMLDCFALQRINILRVGLHPPEDESAFLRGPYHPSFKHLVNVYRWKERFISVLNSTANQEIMEIYANTAQVCYLHELKEILPAHTARVHGLKWLEPDVVLFSVNKQRKMLVKLNVKDSH